MRVEHGLRRTGHRLRLRLRRRLRTRPPDLPQGSLGGPVVGGEKRRQAILVLLSPIVSYTRSSTTHIVNINHFIQQSRPQFYDDFPTKGTSYSLLALTPMGGVAARSVGHQTYTACCLLAYRQAGAWSCPIFQGCSEKTAISRFKKSVTDRFSSIPKDRMIKLLQY